MASIATQYRAKRVYEITSPEGRRQLRLSDRIVELGEREFDWYQKVAAWLPSVRGVADLSRELTPVRTPIGDAWMLAEDEKAIRSKPQPSAPARLLPSGDSYYLPWEDGRSCWCPRPNIGPLRCGRLGYGLAPCSWVVKLWALGADPPPRFPYGLGATCRRRNAKPSRGKRCRCHCPASVAR